MPFITILRISYGTNRISTIFTIADGSECCGPVNCYVWNCPGPGLRRAGQAAVKFIVIEVIARKYSSWRIRTTFRQMISGAACDIDINVT